MRMRIIVLTAIGVLIAPPLIVSAYAQAPPVGPVLLILPSSPRAVALGNAWVAGRDFDVVFYNPAQISPRAGLDLSLTRIGPSATMATLGSGYAAGKWSLTLGWGAEILRFSADPAAPYPFAPDALLARGTADGVSGLFAVGGAITYRGFRIGATGKYAFDSVPSASGAPGGPSPHQSAWLVDFGVSRSLWRGVVAGSVQNLSRASTDGSRPALPRQALVGWSIARPAGPLDLSLFTQLTIRDGWTAPGAGLEVGFSWIEGYAVAFRVGARRPEVTTQQPIAFGTALTADRLTIEYAVQMFDGGRAAHGVTVRWR